MKSLNMFIRQLLVLTMLAVSVAAVQANDRGGRSVGSLEQFETAAVVNRSNSVELVANGQRYRYSQSISFLEGSLKSSVGELKAGDHVWLKGKILTGVRYIDTISVLPSDSDA